MILVKTVIGLSTIHGHGLFAAEEIAAGQIIWKFIDGLDLDISQEQFDCLPQMVQYYLRVFAYYDSGRWMMSGDHGRFINHSDNANTITGRFRADLIAARDISKGEEITEDYRTFDFGTEKLACIERGTTLGCDTPKAQEGK